MHPDPELLGEPLLEFRDAQGEPRTLLLGDAAGCVTVGRFPGADLCLSWDDEVSRVHAELEQVGGEWTVSDRGLSRNGTFVNGERVWGRVRLRSGDVLRFGSTNVRFRGPGEQLRSTVDDAEAPSLTGAQRRVLVALCRPYRHGAVHASPAGNRAIADELVLSIAAVKTHVRSLFERFGVEDLPENRKRARLVELAFASGAITEEEFER